MKLWSSKGLKVLTISSARMNTMCGLLLQRLEVTASSKNTSLINISHTPVFTYREWKETM
jgi:hypothetical protein